MKWFRIFTGILLVTSSVAGDATGKVGKNGFGVAELSSEKGQATASFIHDTTYGMADTWTEKGWTTNNGTIHFAADVFHTVGDLSGSVGSVCADIKGRSKSAKERFASLEQKSADLNKTGKNLFRDHQYRDLKDEDFEFDYKASSEPSQLDNDKEDWVLLTEESEVFFDAVEYQE